MKKLLIPFLVLAVPACGDPEGVADPIAQVVVFGTVTTPSGARLNVTVEAGAVVGACPATVPRNLRTVTDEQNRYRIRIERFGAPFQGCVEVAAVPPAGSMLSGAVARREGVEFRGTLPPDSIQVDLVMR